MINHTRIIELKKEADWQAGRLYEKHHNTGTVTVTAEEAQLLLNTYEHYGDPKDDFISAEEHDEIVKTNDEYIQNLENQVNDLQTEADNLTSRLEELEEELKAAQNG